MEQYLVTGMSCAACAARVEKAVNSVEGVDSCAVSLLTNSMGVEGSASADAIIKAVTDAGYGARLKSASTEAKAAGTSSMAAAEEMLADHETPVLKRRLITSIGFLLILMYVSMGHTMWGWPLPAFFHGNAVAIGLLQMVLTVIVMVINQKFFISGFKSLFHRAPNMDTLVALGSAASFVYSLVMLFVMTRVQADEGAHAAHHYLHEFYFESAAMILTLITVGKMLEAKSKGRTTDAIKGLMKLAPKTATVVRGEEVVIPIEEVQVGDRFLVKPGENIPVDGVVEEGVSAVNEAALTGESIPVDKHAGDAVSAATTNLSGHLTCRATKVGEDTTLSQIIQMVSDAAATKAPIAKIADKVSGIFVPTVIGIAIVTFVIWMIAGQTIGFALARAISVLVISCPCALGLATPVAIMVANGKGAKSGIMFKTAASLEQTGKTDIVVLDKTGTITTGEPKVTDILPAEGVTQKELLETAYALEIKREHPLAKAVSAYAETKQIAVKDAHDFQIEAGNGLHGTVDGATCYGGNAEYIGKVAAIPASLSEHAARLSGEGKTPLYFAADSKLLGVIAVADVQKEEAPEAIKALQNLGIQTVMLTGDNEKTARAIASKVGVANVIANVKPNDKESVVRELQNNQLTDTPLSGSVRTSKTGRVSGMPVTEGDLEWHDRDHGYVVTMVGDGINDSPALTRADTGMAIGAGTDIAIDAADVVLMKSRLTDVPAAIRLSRACLNNIHQNLFWAFFYNVCGIPLAAGLFIPVTGWEMNPMFGAAAMSLSSFFVVSNALRLNLFDPFDASHDRPRKKVSKGVETLPQGAVSDRVKSDVAKGGIEAGGREMTKTITIEGMMCAHCEKTVKGALEALEGVAEANVSHEKGEAVVTLSEDVSDEVLTKAVTEKDYTVKAIA
ncbi:MAG: heavy metal translocating P-type ATPase [Lachnospiraceae bacterium]|nr:heavy metal translocating P-type ATPase [Lachnospiraceae bacterium]